MDVIKEIFWLCLGIMKNILSLAEFKLGKGSEDYRYFKKQTMDFFYNGLNTFYSNLKDKGHVVDCECSEKIRQGYSKCDLCGGSGFKIKK